MAKRKDSVAEEDAEDIRFRRDMKENKKLHRRRSSKIMNKKPKFDLTVLQEKLGEMPKAARAGSE